jgi:type II secretory pathway pseudopilin PulG
MDATPVMRNLRHGTKTGAFTLTEVLVAILVGLLVLAGVHRIFVAGIKTQNTTSLQTEVNRKAQVAMDDMISRLRGASGVVDASPNRIWFVDQEDRNCRYWVNEGTLRRYCGVASGNYSDGVALATDVAELQIDYFDRDGQPTATDDAAHSVTVLLQLDRSRHSARLQSAVRLRNK